ncbi:hypothetical protein RJ40_12625 [Methanofollis aquaemaris]|uniref:4Fe-4S domain-containing protein n=1 Tax=Methanofollis aquaemaris TaxID=126734 RepID=A0A8A3S816_9EURY|nr:DUF2148 domain-containing protein [Methanofollis aquaemaris]QSZ68278.1 hypothetical protein RJ40_12625 [Methanofollis aquaemaris]
MTPESEAVRLVASLMALSARTAPKGKGVDTIETAVLVDADLTRLADAMRAFGEEHDLGFFLRDAKNVEAADACLLIGCRGAETAAINCGACGYLTCTEMTAALRAPRRGGAPFAGPNCAVRMTDLGIAVGSAVKTASIHNVDNRVLYSGGVGARTLGLLEGCTVVYAVPLKASGKNIFFDRT